jgi:hypothetical protein
MMNREALLIVVGVTNHPVWAARERARLLMAQPPLLGKEGNVANLTITYLTMTAILSQHA